MNNNPITFNINLGLPRWTYFFLPIILPLVGLGIAIYTWIMTPIKYVHEVKRVLKHD